ncbi:MAG: FkbM family methyltransferase [Nitrosopumilus sp.]|nr:MAG: FkbM family methyltransferase [Nitrosopumilus sp.]
MDDHQIKSIVRQIYQKKLLRNIDEIELLYFFNEFKNNKLNESSLISLLESSDEFKSINDLKQGFTMTNQGFQIFLDPEDQIISRYLAIKKIWEPEETDFFNKSICEGMTVIDIGANIGYFTLLFSNLVGNSGKVIAFEPNPRSFKILNKNTQSNIIKNVTLFPNALGKFNHSTKLFLSKINFGDNRISKKLIETTDLERKAIDVDVITLDDVLQNMSVDFLKIDAQGSEMNILQGAKNIIKKNEQIKMVIEFWPIGLMAHDCQPIDFLTELKSLKFNIYDFSDIKNEITIEQLCNKYTGKSYTNLFCVKNTN